MTEYKINNATVRIHGTVDHDKLKAATERYLKRAEACLKAKRKEVYNVSNRRSDA